MAMKLGNDVVLDEITAAVERGAQAAAERARRRDMFAAAALQGLLATPGAQLCSYDAMTKEAWAWADSMLVTGDATAGACRPHR